MATSLIKNSCLNNYSAFNFKAVWYRGQFLRLTIELICSQDNISVTTVIVQIACKLNIPCMYFLKGR